MRLWKAKGEPSSKPAMLPERSQAVILSTSAGGHIPAMVIAREGTTVLVAILVPVKPLSPRQLEGLVIEYTGPRGRVRLQGSASVPDPSEPDVLRIEEPRSIEVLQEREYVRIQTARPVVVYAGADMQKLHSFTVDLSGGGFLLAGPDTLRMGEDISFQLTMGQGEPALTGKGRVVRIDGRGRRAVAFQDISDLDRRRLVRFIFQCQRSERQRGLQQDDRFGDEG